MGKGSLFQPRPQAREKVLGKRLRFLGAILVPIGRVPLDQHRDSQPLDRSDFLNMRCKFVSYSQPIRLFRLKSEHAQSDGKSVSPGLLVFDHSRHQRRRFLWPTPRIATSGWVRLSQSDLSNVTPGIRKVTGSP